MTVLRKADVLSNKLGNSLLPRVLSLVAAAVLVMTLVAPVLASTADPTAVHGSIAPISDAGRSAKADGRANVARPLSDDKIAPDVQVALERYGKADVVIALVQPPEMAEMQTNLEALRTEVARLQHAVLAELDADEFELRVAYQAVPALAGRLLDENALATLEAHPGVAKVDLDVGGTGTLDVSVPLIQADQRHAQGNRGAGVLVAVLDSGADTDHPDLADDIAGQACFGDQDGSINGVGFCPGGSDRRTGLGSAEDDAGHGTHVTGIITSRGTVSSPGVAPDANILAIKVTDNCSYSGCFYNFSEIVAALDYLINSQPQVKVINMSLGTFAQFAGDCDNSTSFNMAGAAAINTLRANGVTAFAASGNTGSGTTMGSPACLSNVISVGATDDIDDVASFTSTSSTTDIMAPGVEIVSLAIGGGAFSASGTSMASPHAAGCAALLIEAGTATTPGQIETHLESSGVQVTDPTNNLTFPRIDCSPSNPPPQYTLDVVPASQTVCVGTDAPYTVKVGEMLGYSDSVSLSISGNPAGTTTSFTSNPVTPAGNSILTIGNTGSVPAGDYAITVSASSTSGGRNVLAGLTLIDSGPAAPALTAPANGSTGQPMAPTFTWNAVPGATSYDFEVATDPDFSSVVWDALDLTDTTYTLPILLQQNGVYYWRVWAGNDCAGTASATSAFVVGEISFDMYCTVPNLDIPDDDMTGASSYQNLGTFGQLVDLNVWVQATHTRVSDLVFTVSNVDTGVSAIIIDRPGIPASSLGCEEDDIDAYLDDDEVDPVEDACSTTPPAIDGYFIPNEPLSVFTGQEFSGLWSMTASDLAASEMGTLTEWCLEGVTNRRIHADYSDLASSFGVAWHTGDGVVRLGPNWTADLNFVAESDNTTDDGVSFLTDLRPGQPATMRVNVQGTPASGRWLRAWFDWDNNGQFDSGERVFDDLVEDGDNDLVLNVPSGANTTVAYRVRLYDSAIPPAQPEALDANSYGEATSGEVEDGEVAVIPLAVSLAAFNAEAQVDHVLVSWETSSEIDNQGFKIWRGPSNAAPQTLLGFVPSQAPGSGQGFSYAYQDLAVTPGQTTWYWLETVDVNGVTELHGPVSAMLQSPTNVALNDFGADNAPNENGPGWFIAAGAVMLGALAGIRWRLHRQLGV